MACNLMGAVNSRLDRLTHTTQLRSGPEYRSRSAPLPCKDAREHAGQFFAFQGLPDVRTFLQKIAILPIPFLPG